MPEPGSKKMHRAYLWADAPRAFEALKAVVYDFNEGRTSEHARAFLGNWQSSLICDDYSGYKACSTQGVAEVGCMAHARRELFELHVSSKSLLVLAEQALQSIGQLYEIERQAKELADEDRRPLREEQAKPLADRPHQWMVAQRQRVPDGSATAKALDYRLKRCVALGRNNWLFAGSLRAGKRAAL